MVLLAENIELFCGSCRYMVKRGRDWPDPADEQLSVTCKALSDLEQEAAVMAKLCTSAVNSSGTPGINIGGTIQIRG